MDVKIKIERRTKNFQNSQIKVDNSRSYKNPKEIRALERFYFLRISKSDSYILLIFQQKFIFILNLLKTSRDL